MNSENNSPRRKSIYRTSKTKGTTSGYTQIDNDLLQDKKLSDRARGLLARMLSRPDNWIFYMEQLAESGRDSTTKIRGAFSELRERGYLVQIQPLDEKTKRRNGSTHIVFENPDMPEKRQVGNTACRKSPTKKNDAKKNEKVRDPQTPSADMSPIPDEEAEPDEESPNHRAHDEIKSKAPSDSPASLGAPSSSISRKERRFDRWEINRAPVPLGGTLEEFSKSRWCMALAGLLRIESVSQPEARLMLRAIGKTIGVTEMLWVQLVHVRRHPEPWHGGWEALRDRLQEIRVLNEHGDSQDQDDIKDAIPWLLVQDRGDQCLEFIQSEMLRARDIPIPAEEPKLMHWWALHWRAYLEEWKTASTGAILKLHDSIFSTLYIQPGTYNYNPTVPSHPAAEAPPAELRASINEVAACAQADDGMNEQDDLYEWAITNHQIEDPQHKKIAETAETLRRLYCEKVRGLPGIHDFELPSAENEITLWKMVARACVGAGATPSDFIAAQFPPSDTRQVFPASQLIRDLAIANYRVYARKMGVNSVSEELTPSAEEVVRTTLRYAGEEMQRAAGTCDPTNPKVMDLLRREWSGMDPYIRCLLCYEDPEVMKRYRDDAAQYLLTNPSIRMAIRKIGYPLDHILDP